MKKDPVVNELPKITGSFSPEFQLLLYSLQEEIGAKDLPRINQLLEDQLIDWNLFLDLAEHHRIYPLIYQRLESLGVGAVPESVIIVLRQKAWINATKALQMTGELINVLKGMEEKRIRVVVLKGFPLGYKLYGNIALRPSKDLDLLVWPEDLDQAMQVIENLGYERKNLDSTATSARLRNWMIRHHHFDYWHKEKEICLELHWDLGHKGFEIPLRIIDHSLVQLNISGQTLNILEKEELLLFLSLHGAAHAWFRLKWLCDVGVILRQGGFSWERLYTLSEHLKVEAILNQAIILAHNLLQVPVPDSIIKRVFNDQKAVNLVCMVLPFITTVKCVPSQLEKNTPLFKQRKKYRSKLLPWRKKVGLFFNKFSPVDSDLELIPLPNYFYFLYYLIRPFTWLGRKVKILAKRLESEARI